MVHEASTMALVTNLTSKTLNALNAIDTSIVDIYQERTGLDRDEIINLITNETRFTADEAIKKVLQMKNHLVNRLIKNREGVNNVKDTKYVAMLATLQTITAMIDEAEEDPEPSSGDSLEQRSRCRK